MTHEMNLQDKYFDFILRGTKRIELRLNDEKRQQIKIGDTIIFRNEQGETFSAEVKDLFKYNSFEELFENFEIDILADKSTTKTELLQALGEFYSTEKQKEFGVLGILIELTLVPGQTLMSTCLHTITQTGGCP